MTLGVEDCAVLSLDDLLGRVEARMEKSVRELTKAILESSLGELGTVGALRDDEFWHTFKTALQEVIVKQRVDGTSREFSPSVELSSVDLASHGTVPVLSVSGTSSHVPTVFGGPGSVAAVEDPVVGTSAAPRPGNLSQDHMQCCTNLGV